MTPQELLSYKEALERLFQVSAPALGRVYKPRFTRHMALAKADEMKTVAAAMHEVGKDYGLEVTYKQGDFEMSNKPAVPPIEFGEVSLVERAEQRLAYQEQKRQQNGESVTGTAMLELMANPTIPEERPDEDWTTRFFSSAQDISSEQMQELWGRILAGEIRKPGAFSLRTLDFIRNLTTEEAQIFARVVRLAYRTEDDFWLVPRHDREWLAQSRGITYRDINVLVELGLVNSNYITLEPFDEGEQESVLIADGHCIIMNRGTITEKFSIWIHALSALSMELLPLVDRPFDEEQAILLSQLVAESGGSAVIGRFTDPPPHSLGSRIEVLHRISS